MFPEIREQQLVDVGVEDAVFELCGKRQPLFSIEEVSGNDGSDVLECDLVRCDAVLGGSSPVVPGLEIFRPPTGTM
jgi:hypothetical protein